VFIDLVQTRLLTLSTEIWLVDCLSWLCLRPKPKENIELLPFASHQRQSRPSYGGRGVYKPG